MNKIIFLKKLTPRDCQFESNSRLLEITRSTNRSDTSKLVDMVILNRTKKSDCSWRKEIA